MCLGVRIAFLGSTQPNLRCYDAFFLKLTPIDLNHSIPFPGFWDGSGDGTILLWEV